MTEMTVQDDGPLVKVMSGVPAQLEQQDDLVVCAEETQGVRALILHVVQAPAHFDWDVSTLTGFGRAEFLWIAGKLPVG